MKISIVTATDEEGNIGINGQLPWKMPADLKHFQDITRFHIVVMGRKTFESIGKPLKDRLNVVLTSNLYYQANGCVLVNSATEAIKYAYSAGEDELMVIGGALVYEEFLPLAEKVYLTRIHGVFSADTKFPPIKSNDWIEVSREICKKDEKNPYDYDFIILERVKSM